jgi:hypothetical protein
MRNEVVIEQTIVFHNNKKETREVIINHFILQTKHPMIY